MLCLLHRPLVRFFYLKERVTGTRFLLFRVFFSEESFRDTP